MTLRRRSPSVCGVAVAVAAVVASRAAANTWTRIPGPDGGSVVDVQYDPLAPTTLYASTRRGVFKSVDGAATWSEASGGLGGAGVVSTAVDPRTPGVLYALRDDPQDLWRSADGGASWSPTALSAGADDVGAVAVGIGPGPGTTVYALAGKRAYRSTDGGQTWASTLLPVSVTAISFGLATDPLTPGVVYAAQAGAAGFGGVSKSTDGGATWAVASTGLGGRSTTAITVDPVTPTTLYVWAFDAFNQSSLFKSTDGAATWVALPLTFTCFGDLAPVVVDASDPSHLYTSRCFGVVESHDGGLSWAPTAGSLPPFILTLALAPQSPPALYAGILVGLFETTDGAATWHPAITGIDALSVRNVAVDPTDPGHLAVVGDIAGFYRTLDDGGTWVDGAIELGGQNGVLFDPVTPATMYAAGSSGFSKSIDGGATWEERDDGIASPNAGVASPVVDPVDPAVLYVAGAVSDVYKSVDGAASWVPLGLGVPIGPVAMDPGDHAKLAAVSLDSTQAFASNDAGASWTPYVTGIPPDRSMALAVDPFVPSRWYLATQSQGFFRSLDGGMTWAHTSSGLEPFPGGVIFLRDTVADPVRPGVVYTLTQSYGVFGSSDAGDTWHPINVGLTSKFGADLALDGRPATRLHVATGAGVFRLPLAPCATAADCDDGNGCTADACGPVGPGSDPFGCSYTPVVCGAPGACQLAGTCNPASGVCEHPARPDGTACPPDASLCTRDVCLAGVCDHDATPAMGCLAPVAPRAASLLVRRPASGEARLTWKWRKGAPVTFADLGDPLTAGQSDYELCVVDRGGPGGRARLLLGARLPAGGSCGARSCWSPSGLGLRYDDRDGTPDGVEKARFRPGGAGKASMMVKARGAMVGAVPLPATTPVTVQLRRDDAATCWSAGYDGVVRRSDARMFDARSD